MTSSPPDAWLGAPPDLGPPERIDLAAFQFDLDKRITLGRFAALIGKADNTVVQHRFGYWNAAPATAANPATDPACRTVDYRPQA